MLQLCFLIQLNFLFVPCHHAVLIYALLTIRHEKHLLGLEEHPALALNTCFGCRQDLRWSWTDFLRKQQDFSRH